MAGDNNILNDPKLYILLVAASSASLMVTIYHRIIVCWHNHHPSQQEARRRFRAEMQETASGIELVSVAQLIPAHKYQKSVGLGLVGEDSGMCAVCLSEFEEGEDCRTLSECMHSFHVPCIDMWLYSHPNCPICRTDAMPLKFQRSPGSGELERPQDSGILQDIVVVQSS